MALEFIGIPTDGDGDGAEAAPPGFLMCGNWLMHDKYDTAAHDKDTVVVKYGVREGAGGLRIGVEGGPPHGMAYCPVLVSD